jgi:GT2 family glycosyltransferase
MALRASVTIATWKRRELLRKLVLALEEQTIPWDEYEIIVCDSGSPDGTAEMVHTLSQSFGNIKYVDIPVNTLAAKRNAGIRRASAPIAIFLDDDVLVDKHFIEAHLRAHVGRSKVVFCGQVRFPADWVKSSNYFRFRDSRHLGATRPEVNNRDIPFHLIVVMNLSFKRDEILQSVGWVSEEFKSYGCEDYEFGYRMAEAGMKIELAEDAIVYHYEAGGTIAQYMKKMYIAARHSVPILHRLVPDSVNRSAFRYLEPVSQVDAFGMIICKRALRICTNRFFSKMIHAFLEKTDHFPWLYMPLLFRYLFAAAYVRGVEDRIMPDGYQTQEERVWFD